MTDRIFCHFEPFLHSYPPSNPRARNSEKMKKTGNIILHKCTKNHDHICYTVLEIRHKTDAVFIFHFELKSKFSKNEKNALIYYHFTYVYHK